MKICAIDSSGLVASVAILDEGILTAEYSINYKITHSQTLLPMLSDIKNRVDLELSDIDAFAVTAGPGSFTGLRIGAATVKGLDFVYDKPVVAVPTLETLAYNAYGFSDVVCPIMDARRGQVYTGIYDYIYEENDFSLHIIKGQMAVAFEDLCNELNNIGKRVLFIGDGIPVYLEQMKALLRVEYSLAPAHMNRQRAGALAALGEVYIIGKGNNLEGQVTNSDGLAPVYLRMSQAERERKEKQSEA